MNNWIYYTLDTNCLIKHNIEGKIQGEKEEDISSYWITLKKGEDTRN
jgi:hypothetical protein